jgi:hypothetical protein
MADVASIIAKTVSAAQKVKWMEQRADRQRQPLAAKS